MCGIIGVASSKKADLSLILRESLQWLAYRGYDSAGIAIKTENGIFIHKNLGLVKDLKLTKIIGEIGIGHTRWATHGKPSKINAHPHSGCPDSGNEITVVHNGIIENYSTLKEELLGKGHKFKSETDTEVIPHLIEENLPKYIGNSIDPFLSAFRNTIRSLRGNFAIVAIWNKEDKIFAAKYCNPLVLGIGEGSYYVASDIPAFRKHTANFIPLEDGYIAEITGTSATIYDGNLEPVPVHPFTCTFTLDDISKSGYPHYMLKEICEQDTVLEKIIQRESDIQHTAERICKNIGKIKKVYFLGCGTSFHSCMAAENMFERILHIQSEALLSSEFRLTNHDMTFEDSLFVILSQSGETLDTLISLKAILSSNGNNQGSGPEIILIDNYPFSSLERLFMNTFKEESKVLYLNAGPEICVLATKTYSAQLYILALLALHIGSMLPETNKNEILDMLNEARNIPAKVRTILKDSKRSIGELALQLRGNWIGRLVNRIANKRTEVFFTIGRGVNLATARESALKLKEVSYASVEGMAGGELKHGSLAVVSNDTPVFVFFPPPSDSEVSQSTLNNYMEINARTAPIIAVCSASDNSPIIKELSKKIISVPDTCWIFNPILQVIPIQLLGYQFALLKNIDPDHPRNLAKTVTVE